MSTVVGQGGGGTGVIVMSTWAFRGVGMGMDMGRFFSCFFFLWGWGFLLRRIIHGRGGGRVGFNISSTGAIGLLRGALMCVEVI